MSSTSSDNLSLESDLYLRLNLPKEATADDLKRSFRKLSQRYHPDKHVDQSAKQAATDRFTLVKEAYEILSDSKLRKVYDEFGLDAARIAASHEMEMVPYSDLADRFRKDPNNPNPSAGINTPRDAYFTVINSLEPRLDATGLVVALQEGDPISQPRLAVFSQVSINAMATAYVTQRHTVAARYSLRGDGPHASGRHGTGVGDLAVSVRSQVDSYTTAEATAFVPLDENRAPTFGLKLFRALSEDMTGSYEASYDPQRQHLTSALTFARSFDDRCTASTSWAVGAGSGFSFTWRRSAYDEYVTDVGVKERKEGEDGAGGGEESVAETRVEWLVDRLTCLIAPVGYRMTARMNGMDYSFGFLIRRPIGENAPLWKKCQPTGPGGASVKLRAHVGVMGWEVEVGGGMKYVLADTAWGTSVSLGTVGVVWRLKVTRAGHRFSLPVVLVSSMCDARVATVAAVTSCLAVSALQILVLDPLRRSKESQERAEAKQRRGDMLAQARSEAEAAITLMARSVEQCRKRENEVEIDGRKGCGLLIERAVYGISKAVRELRVGDADLKGNEIADLKGNEIEREMADVTDSVQMLVEQSRVQVVSGTKSTLMGFWDPSAFGDKEDLVVRIWYRFKGEPHECIIRDNEAIELPLSSHRVPSAS